MSEELLVLLYGEVVGVLQRADAAEGPSFTYLTEYVQDGSVALSARLPIASSPYAPERAGPFLTGLIPEHRDARERWARQLGTADDDVFAMLSQMGWECPGAVQFCRPEDLDRLTSREPTYVEVDEGSIAQRLRDLVADPAVWTMPGEHWSLGGQQEKFALASLDETWYEARGAAATTHIVKPGIKTLHHQALVEHVTMTAAAALDLDIAGTRLMRFEDQWAIVVDRFDRVVDDSRNVFRLHQEDFCQALGRLPDRKYEHKGGPSLVAMVRTLNQQSSDRDDDLLALADFLIINVVAGAPDGHSKNISLIRTPGRTWVAPLYDLATALVYDTDRVERTVAVSVGEERDPARIYGKQWDRAALALALPADLVRARAAHLAATFPDAYQQALSNVSDAPGAVEVADRSIPVVQSHCKGILARL